MQRPLIAVGVAFSAPHLDADLAGGRAPETSPRHALRARQLVAPRRRSALAQSWERLLLLVDAQKDGASTRAPVRRDRVRRAGSEIRRLITALRANGPVPAQGVAMAARLLSDGTGPLYNPRATDVLEELLAGAVEHLNPALPLTDGVLEATGD